MLGCVKPSSSGRPDVHLSIPSKQANSSPWSSTQPSPTIDITHEYNIYIQSNSFAAIKSRIHTVDGSNELQESIHVDDHEDPSIDTQILDPNQECVQEALQHAKPGTLTRLVSAYFEHSEATSLLYISLLNRVQNAHSLYNKLQNLLAILPLDSDSDCLTHAQCDEAFNVFIEFSALENPFPCHESRKFHNIRNSFSQLNHQLNHRISKSQSRVNFIGRTTTCAAVCLVGTAVGVTIAAVVIASHALVVLVAAPLLPACLMSGVTKDEVANIALDTAARGTYFLHYDLNMIDSLVERLYSAVEDDKNLIRLVLAGGCDRHPIHLLAKQLQKNYNNIRSQLVDLEEHVCLCIAAINSTRSKLLEEIHHYQSQVQ